MKGFLFTLLGLIMFGGLIHLIIAQVSDDEYYDEEYYYATKGALETPSHMKKNMGKGI